MVEEDWHCFKMGIEIEGELPRVFLLLWQEYKNARISSWAKWTLQKAVMLGPHRSSR